ncbi:MBL fold metallo-hydrolase [Anoxybacillus flavithermus]|nr:MBL fold metallo-hydrolase [Anoxybacillus flavithermus]
MKRLSDPGILLHDMPNVDVILISHSHYDHLHFSSIKSA